MNAGGPATICALCEIHAGLRRSHIVPRFVSRALKVPDGPARALLCSHCEDLFGGYESTFARAVFHPLLADARLVAKYEQWLLQFAVSVCWRVLEAHLTDTSPAPVSPLVASRETWRQFLRGKLSGVAAHPIHLLRAERGREEAIETAVVANDDESFVYARLGPVVLLGMITDPDHAQWQGTRIHLQGKLKPREIVVPARYGDYLAARSFRHASS